MFMHLPRLLQPAPHGKTKLVNGKALGRGEARMSWEGDWMGLAIDANANPKIR